MARAATQQAIDLIMIWFLLGMPGPVQDNVQASGIDADLASTTLLG
jgi:hypothetical protein